MDGFNENDTIPSFNSSDLIEEIDEDDDNFEAINNKECMQSVDGTENNDDDSSRSSSDSYGPMHRPNKRFKKAVTTENLFKMEVMKILKQSCEVAGDFAVSGKFDRTPLVAISLKVIFTSMCMSRWLFSNFFFLSSFDL